MALTAGAITVGTVTSTSVVITVATPSIAGTAPYTYQWYMSTVSGFTPGGGNIISGATSLSRTQTGLIPGTTYYFKNIVTDSASPAATSTASSSATSTLLTTPNPNQFAQASLLGMVDMPYSFNTQPAMIDLTETGTLYAGQAVKLVANTSGGVLKVAACSADSDACVGFINYDVKNVGWTAGKAVEISMKGNVMYLYSTTAITQGAQVQMDVSTIGGVAADDNTGASYVGWAYDGAAAAGALIRVYLECPSFATL